MWVRAQVMLGMLLLGCGGLWTPTVEPAPLPEPPASPPLKVQTPHGALQTGPDTALPDDFPFAVPAGWKATSALTAAQAAFVTLEGGSPDGMEAAFRAALGRVGCDPAPALQTALQTLVCPDRPDRRGLQVTLVGGDRPKATVVWQRQVAPER